MMKLACTMFFCWLCVGCATKKYSAPPGVELAQFVMSVNIDRVGTPGYTTVKALSEQCKKNEDGDVLGNFMQLVNFEPQEVQIRANKKFVYEFDYSAPSSQYLEGALCWVRSGFIPESGKKYHAQFTFRKNSCQTTLSEMTSNESKIFVKTFKPDCR